MSSDLTCTVYVHVLHIASGLRLSVSLRLSLFPFGWRVRMYFTHVLDKVIDQKMIKGYCSHFATRTDRLIRLK